MLGFGQKLIWPVKFGHFWNRSHLIFRWWIKSLGHKWVWNSSFSTSDNNPTGDFNFRGCETAFMCAVVRLQFVCVGADVFLWFAPHLLLTCSSLAPHSIMISYLLQNTSQPTLMHTQYVLTSILAHQVRWWLSKSQSKTKKQKKVSVTCSWTCCQLSVR